MLNNFSIASTSSGLLDFAVFEGVRATGISLTFSVLSLLVAEEIVHVLVSFKMLCYFKLHFNT